MLPGPRDRKDNVIAYMTKYASHTRTVVRECYKGRRLYNTLAR